MARGSSGGRKGWHFSPRYYAVKTSVDDSQYDDSHVTNLKTPVKYSHVTNLKNTS
jgi:hypothetical protein